MYKYLYNTFLLLWIFKFPLSLRLFLSVIVALSSFQILFSVSFKVNFYLFEKEKSTKRETETEIFYPLFHFFKHLQQLRDGLDTCSKYQRLIPGNLVLCMVTEFQVFEP